MTEERLLCLYDELLCLAEAQALAERFGWHPLDVEG